MIGLTRNFEFMFDFLSAQAQFEFDFVTAQMHG